MPLPRSRFLPPSLPRSPPHLPHSRIIPRTPKIPLPPPPPPRLSPFPRLRLPLPPRLHFLLPSRLHLLLPARHRLLLALLTRYLIAILTTLPLFVFIKSHVASLTPVIGMSMFPLLNGAEDAWARDVVFVDMWRPMTDLRRGMVVVFWSPTDPEVVAVKRIVALEYDTVRTKAPFKEPSVTVPKGHVWVEGEHPESGRWSLDSNYYGPISMSLLVGKVRARVFPFGRMGLVRWQDWKGSERVRKGGPVEEDEDEFEF